MQTFFVIGDPKLNEKIVENFPTFNYPTKYGWAIAAKNKTASDIGQLLGMNSTDKLEGAVFALGSYNGWADVEVWEKLSLWKEMDNDDVG